MTQRVVCPVCGAKYFKDFGTCPGCKDDDGFYDDLSVEFYD